MTSTELHMNFSICSKNNLLFHKSEIKIWLHTSLCQNSKQTWPTLIIWNPLTNLQIILADPIQKFWDEWVRLLLSAYEVTAGTTIPTEHIVW